MKKIFFSLLACSFFVSQQLTAADFGGQFSFHSPAGVVHMTLEQGAQGQLSGSLSDDVSSFRLQGQAEGATASGYVKAEYPPDRDFAAQLGQ